MIYGNNDWRDYLIHRLLPGSNFLMHHGKKGQKWGIRNGPPYPLENGYTKNYNYDNLRSTEKPTVILPKREYAHVMSEVMTHISDEQRKQKVFNKAIGDYVYEIENNPDYMYRVIGKTKIKDFAETVGEVLFDE